MKIRRETTIVTQARENCTSIQNKENEENKLHIRKKLKKKNTFIQFIYIYTDSENEIHNRMTIRQPIMFVNTEFYFLELLLEKIIATGFLRI